MTERIYESFFKGVVEVMSKNDRKEFVRYLIDEDLVHTIFNQGGK